MARLTWQNVSAPSFAGVTDAYRLAGQLMNNGFNAADRALTDFQKSRQQQADQQLMSDVLQYTDPNSLNTALHNGSLLDGRSGVSADALKFVNNQSGKLLSNQATAQANSQAQWSNDKARAFEAARPDAIAKLTEIRQLYQQGTPEAKAQADQLMSNSTGVFAAAGWTPDHVTSFMQGNDQAINTGIQQKDTFNQAADAAKTRQYNLAGDQLAKDLLSNSADANAAARKLQNMTNEDPNVKAAALAKIAEYGKTNGPGATYQDLLVKAQTQQAGNPLQSLVDQHEGGGRYNTLYGNAQSKSGPLAGVDVSKATIGQLTQFASKDGAYGRHQIGKLGYLATPMGRYQIVGQTLRDTAKEMGLSPDTVFTPQVQDAMFNHIATKAINSSNTMQGKMKALRGQWDGFKHVPDAQLAQAITAFQNGDTTAITGRGGAADYASSAGSQPGNNPAASLIADLTRNNGQPPQAANLSAGPGQNPGGINVQDLTGVQSTATDLITRSQDLQNKVTLNSAFDQTAPIMQTLSDKSTRSMSNADASKNLMDKIGDNSGIDRAEVDYFINWAKQRYGVTADIAAAMIQQSVGKTSWGVRWIWGDRSANKDTLDTIYKNVFGKGSFNESKGKTALARMGQNQLTKTVLANASNSVSALAPAQQEYYNAVNKFGSGSPQAQTAKLRLDTLAAIAKKQLAAADKNPMLTANINSQTGR